MYHSVLHNEYKQWFETLLQGRQNYQTDSSQRPQPTAYRIRAGLVSVQYHKQQTQNYLPLHHPLTQYYQKLYGLWWYLVRFDSKLLYHQPNFLLRYLRMYHLCFWLYMGSYLEKLVVYILGMLRCRLRYLYCMVHNLLGCYHFQVARSDM